MAIVWLRLKRDRAGAYPCDDPTVLKLRRKAERALGLGDLELDLPRARARLGADAAAEADAWLAGYLRLRFGKPQSPRERRAQERELKSRLGRLRKIVPREGASLS